MAVKASRRLVIDASVARSSGGEDAVYPTSKYCRGFLKSVLEICHHIVMTQDVIDEWNRHQSNFARRWRVSMEARKKIERIDAPPQGPLRDKIEATTSSEIDCQAMLKDVFLIEAAIVTDKAIISLDETVRKLFHQSARRTGELRSIVWINSEVVDEHPILWLENGAKPEKRRRLGSISE